MFDNCSLVAHYSHRTELENVLAEFDFRKTFKHKYTGQEFHFFDFEGLSIKVDFLTNKLTLSKSLTTFYKGNNYSNITYSELLFVAEYLSEVLRKKPDEIIPRKIEFALNVETPLAPFEYFSRFQSLKLKPFYFVKPPPGFAKPLECACSMQQYTVKYYDTAKWHRLTGINLLKNEIVFYKMKKIERILNCSDLSLAKIIERDSISSFIQFLTLSNRNIDKRPHMDFTKLSSQQIDLVFAGSIPEYWKAQRRRNPNTAKKKRANYIHLKHDIDQNQNQLFKDLERRIVEKFDELQNS